MREEGREAGALECCILTAKRGQESVGVLTTTNFANQA